MRCALLTTDDLTGYVSDDHLVIRPLVARGCEVRMVPWRARADWASFDGVVVRTTWDYHRHPDAFLEVLGTIRASGTRLENPLELIRWNLRKSYLRELAARGVAVVPTVWLDRLEEGALGGAARQLGAREIVVKPAVGASGEDTFRVAACTPASLGDALHATFAARPLMVQPFLATVESEGEWAVVFIDGELSHAVRKVAAPGDFRVQEEHGGTVQPVDPDPVLVRAARSAVSWIQPQPLYARADFLRDGNGAYMLGELELIEPSLYLRSDPAAPDRFATAIVRRLTGRGSAAPPPPKEVGC